MEERVGSFIADKDGRLRPNLNDEAMAQRERLKGQGKPEDTEVAADGERGTQIPNPG